MNIGENIKRLRLQAGLTQTQLADTVGISTAMVCQIERGSRTPTMPLGKQIAEALGKTIDDLID
ncbi:MAG: helix-turn-helix domain-containing protein [Clostridiales bacterium]|nr:helix-turn-helix domain-containing protein [Clostridiales bacterium]